MPDIPEYTMPEGMSALTKSEISQLRIKIGKSHRTEKDWTFIKNILREKAVFTAEPIDEKYRAAYSVEGILKDSGYLLIFTTMEGCKDFLDKHGTARFGYQLTLGTIPFTTVVMIAYDYKEKVLLDLDIPENGNILGIDGRDRSLHTVRVMG
ncbi:MAG: hypothetical protein II885_04690 [Oscillospiraceae bacterium]|nr:hypothetical protein [Oscillospiraceae bacterium]